MYASEEIAEGDVFLPADAPDLCYLCFDSCGLAKFEPRKDHCSLCGSKEGFAVAEANGPS
jgi:hypothetical protein